MKQGSGNRRVNEQARQVIADILLFEISDPRLRLVTITGCEVSYDRSVCNVYYAAQSDQYGKVAAAFEKAGGRIRSLMARKLSWRVAPELRFMLDTSVDNAERIGNALAAERDMWEDLDTQERMREAEDAAEFENESATYAAEASIEEEVR